LCEAWPDRASHRSIIRPVPARADRGARVLKQVHAVYVRPLSVEEMVRKAGMSVAAFHH
jgi:hypothetical protein